jgi:DNA polymerase-3 subunit alpha
MTFVHLNVRSHASLLHASSQPDDIVKRVAALGQDAVALADYGNVSNAINFYRAAKKEGVKPILGVEVFFTESNAEYRDQKIRQTRHLLLLAENEEGWRNIVRLVSDSNRPENFYFKPRVDFEMLEKRSEGVIALVGGPEGIVSYYTYDKCVSDGSIIDRAAPFKAAALLRRLHTIFDKDHLFLDVQDTGQYFEDQMNQGLRDLARKYGLATVASTNPHYPAQHDAEAHRTLFSMNGKYARSTNADFSTEQFYLRSREEMESTSLTTEELDATVALAARCNVEIDLSKRRLPKYQFVPEGLTAMEHLVALCREGFKKRGLEGKTAEGDESYAERMNRELADIDEMGFADYFLIVHDVVSWCEDQNMLLGHGRGSAGGSLVSYVLDITKMDPLQYGLIWERFLNKGRGGLPDIDTDVPQSRRQEVLAYIRERFGTGNVAQIVTYGGMKARSVLKEVFRVYGVDFDVANRITALVPAKNNDHTQPTLDEALEMVPALREYEKKYKAWFTIARALEGCYKNVGIHAAGVVISDVPFEESDYPLCRSADGNTQLFAWDMNTVDTLSLLKLDILGLTNLDDIQVAMDIASSRGGTPLTRETMPLDDQEAFALLTRGLNIGIFQVEKQLGKNWSKQLQPGSIEEISDLVSLIRPGPLDSGMATQYQQVKAGEADPSYIHHKLEPILGPTKSACLYQEQVIRICQELSGMSLIDADKVRKAMGKKKPEEMDRWQKIFVDGCASFSQIDQETADEIWGFIVTFAGYGFNKSHGVGYGLLTYETAYMKAHHPTEFLCAKLRHAADADETKLLVYDAKLFDIEVVPPRVSAGNEKFDVVGDSQIAFGLTGLRGVGAAAIESVLKLTEIAGTPSPEAFDQILWAIFSDGYKINSSVVKALILSGAFDDFGVQRVRAMAQYSLLAGMTPKQRDKLWELYMLQKSGHDWVRVLRGAVDEDKFEAIKEHFGILLANVAQRAKIRKLLANYDAADPLDRISDKIKWEKEYLGLGLSGSRADGFRVRTTCRDIIRDGYDGMLV